MNAHYADDRSPHAAACDRLPSLEARLAGESHQHDILHTYEHLLHQCGPMRRLMPLHGEATELVRVAHRSDQEMEKQIAAKM